jgi:SSS family solute:Na+ symporter
MVLPVLIAYVAVVLGVGLLGHRLFRGTGEDYFVASRSIGPFVLLMTLFGTNMTAFTILGASGEAYRRGVIVFALMGSSSAILIPFLFYYLGIRCWKLGKQFGYVTQVQLIRDRFGSDGLGVLLFVVVVALMLPYILIGVKGGGDALNALTGGPDEGVPAWVGSLVVCAVIYVYVSYGGMRSTAWVNTLQTAVFVLFGIVAYVWVMSEFGGVSGAMERLRTEHRELVVFGDDRFALLQMGSFLLLPLCTGAFPHLYSHWLSAKTARSFRAAIVAYPVLIALTWFPSVTLGAAGRLEFAPPLDGPILVKLIVANTGDILAGCLAAGVFAAIMSSLDSQILALGAMFTEDIVRHYGFHDQLSEERQVWFGRLFVLAFLALAFVCSIFASQSIFTLGTWALTGFAGLLPMFAAALFWPRATSQGGAASILSVATLWIYFFWDSLSVSGAYSIGGTGLMPVAVIVPVSLVALVVVSLMTAVPDRRFFPPSRE